MGFFRIVSSSRGWLTLGARRPARLAASYRTDPRPAVHSSGHLSQPQARSELPGLSGCREHQLPRSWETHGIAHLPVELGVSGAHLGRQTGRAGGRTNLALKGCGEEEGVSLHPTPDYLPAVQGLASLTMRSGRRDDPRPAGWLDELALLVGGRAGAPGRDPCGRGGVPTGRTPTVARTPSCARP